jgi:hypothetical protein
MKRVIIGALVGMVIFFAFESAMWMSGVHNDFSKYTANQNVLMESISQNLNEDGLYSLPAVDPASPNYTEEHHELMENQIGKPWVMIFYHQSMNDMSGSGMIMGMVLAFLISLVVCLVVYHGNFSSFSTRFMASMAFAIFYLVQGPLSELNWWDFPWHYVKAGVIDIGIGWLLCSAWIAFYVKNDANQAPA